MSSRSSQCSKIEKSDEALTKEACTLTSTDLRSPQCRMEYWDQLHPMKGRFHRVSYQDCQGWEVVQERHLHIDHTTSQYPSSPTWKTWIAGSYKLMYLSKHSPRAEVVIEFDWVKKSDYDAEYCWKVTTIGSERDGLATANPGRHQGLIRHGSQRENYEIKWNTPIFSPCVFLGPLDKWVDDVSAVVGGSKPPIKNTDALEEIIVVRRGRRFEVCTTNVFVIERVLRSICAFLVSGLDYSGTDDWLKPKVKFEGDGHGYHKITGAFFDKKEDYAKAARFFCRAFVPQAREDSNREVTKAEQESTIEAVIAMLDHHTILDEPFWVKDENWANDLESDVRSVRTLGEWRSMEKKWATLTSFACGLRLHEGPWAGQDWEKFVPEQS